MALPLNVTFVNLCDTQTDIIISVSNNYAFDHSELKQDIIGVCLFEWWPTSGREILKIHFTFNFQYDWATFSPFRKEMGIFHWPPILPWKSVSRNFILRITVFAPKKSYIYFKNTRYYSIFWRHIWFFSSKLRKVQPYWKLKVKCISDSRIIILCSFQRLLFALMQAV